MPWHEPRGAARSAKRQKGKGAGCASQQLAKTKAQGGGPPAWHHAARAGPARHHHESPASRDVQRSVHHGPRSIVARRHGHTPHGHHRTRAAPTPPPNAKPTNAKPLARAPTPSPTRDHGDSSIRSTRISRNALHSDTPFAPARCDLTGGTCAAAVLSAPSIPAPHADATQTGECTPTSGLSWGAS